MTYNFRTEDMVEVAYIFNVDVQKIIDASKKVLMLTPNEWSSSNMNHHPNLDMIFSDSYIGIWYNSEIGLPVKTTAQLSDKHIKYILGSAYLMNFPNLKANFDRYYTYLGNYLENKSAIYTITRQIEDRIAQIRDISSRRDNLTLNIITRDPQKVLIKACKKMKIGFEIKDGEYYFTFKNVTIQSPVEGTLKYKSITIITRPNFSIKDIHYQFNGFEIHDSWGLGIGHLHPHVSRTTICYGNRAGDYQAYLQNGAYEFIALLYKESVHTYDNGAPYESLSSIARKVNALEKVVKVHKVFDNGVLITAENNPSAYARLMYSSLRRCRVCNHFLDPSVGENQELVWSSCVNNSCYANPNAQIRCQECERPLVRGNWDYDRYIYECHNAECSRSVQYQVIQRRRNEIIAHLRDLIESRITEAEFIDKNNRSHSITQIDGQFVKCPVCGMPLDRRGDMLSCTHSSPSKLCFSTHFYVLASHQLDTGNLDSLVELYMDSDLPEKLPEDFDMFTEYRHLKGNIIHNLLRIMDNKGYRFYCDECDCHVRWDRIENTGYELLHESCGMPLQNVSIQSLYALALEKKWAKGNEYLNELFEYVDTQTREEQNES